MAIEILSDCSKDEVKWIKVNRIVESTFASGVDLILSRISISNI